MLFSDVDAALVAAEAAKKTALIALLGSGLAALATIVVAFITQRGARRNQRELKQLELKNAGAMAELTERSQRDLKELERQNAEAIARLTDALGEGKSERDARRDYDYEARKRLYKEAEPLLFRLSEASEAALHRIFSLARTARNGDLGSEGNWLDSPGYFMASTIYTLLVPAVIFRLLQDRLTLVDFSLDSRISKHYVLAKRLYKSFTDDFTLAQTDPELPYDPFVEGWKEKREGLPEKHWRQGIAIGKLDTAAEAMISPMTDGTARCLSFGEFDTVFRKDIDSDGSKFGIFFDVFLWFHPASRPILWRILIVQAHLHALIMRAFLEGGATGFLSEIPGDFEGTTLHQIDWRRPGIGIDEDSIVEPVQVARAYLEERLPNAFAATYCR